VQYLETLRKNWGDFPIKLGIHAKSPSDEQGDFRKFIENFHKGSSKVGVLSDVVTKGNWATNFLAALRATAGVSEVNVGQGFAQLLSLKDADELVRSPLHASHLFDPSFA
jgi:hypothetical protein